MSYKKLDERGNHPLSFHQETFDVEDGDHELRSYLPSSSSQHHRQMSSKSSTLEEQNDRRAALSEPLSRSNSNHGDGGTRIYDSPADPFYVFREDLYRKLELVDESLAEYLRVVYQTVRV